MAIRPGVYQQTPTLTSGSAYSSGQCLGALQSLSIPGVARIQAKVLSLAVFDFDNQKAPLTALFFQSDPTAPSLVTPATVADKAAFAWGTAGSLFLGKVDVAGADYETFGGKAVACKGGLQIPIQAASTGGALYVAVVTTGTPTWATTTSLTFTYGFADLNA